MDLRARKDFFSAHSFIFVISLLIYIFNGFSSYSFNMNNVFIRGYFILTLSHAAELICGWH